MGLSCLGKGRRYRAPGDKESQGKGSEARLGGKGWLELRKGGGRAAAETPGLSPQPSEPLFLTSTKTEVSEIKGMETLC